MEIQYDNSNIVCIWLHLGNVFQVRTCINSCGFFRWGPLSIGVDIFDKDYKLFLEDLPKQGNENNNIEWTNHSIFKEGM
jgi:hypothetical protein